MTARIVVISDSHRNSGVIDKILSSQTDAKYVFFLGDNVADIEDFKYLYSDKQFFIVSGNCDYFSEYPDTDIAFVFGKKIIFTHGHNFDVKYGTEKLFLAAKTAECKIALYGHTHVSKIVYEDGLYIVNPGSCARPRNGGPTYAVIDIMESGIMPIIVNL